MLGNLTFQTTGPTVTFSVVVVTIAAALCWIAWQRTAFARGTGMLETLRLALVLLVVLTLNQPEWLELITIDEQPTLVVLHDQSGSMETQDVIDDQRPGSPPLTRREAVNPLLKDAAWAAASDRFNVVFQSFAGASASAAPGTDVNAALDTVAEQMANVRAVLLLSDGDWNEGQPPVMAATRLRLKNVPVFASVVGSEEALPDIELVSVDAPTFGVSRKAMRIPFVVRSTLPRDFEATVTIVTTDGHNEQRTLIIPAKGQTTDSIAWTPEETGNFGVSVRVDPHPTERIRENNAQAVRIAIRDEALKVLIVESFPRWEYRYLRNALDRDPGVECDCLLFHPNLNKVGGGKGYLKEFPEDLEQLSQYDVVMLGDVGVEDGQLTPDQCKLIKGLVQGQASGLILMPGMRGSQFSLLSTELNDLYPVLLDEAQPRGWGSRAPLQFELTDTGRRSLLTRLTEPDDANARLWERLPGFQWFAPVLRSKAGSEVLAVHRSEVSRFGRVPLLVTRTFGTGKVLFMGSDGAWRWREGVEDKYHYRFWGQVARWMAYQRNMAEGESMRLFFSPDRPTMGNVITLNANVMSRNGEPLQSGTVSVQVVTPDGKTETVRLLPRGEDWGLFTGEFAPEYPGDYQMKMTCVESGDTLETTLSVQGEVKEKLGRPVRSEVLEEIASVTRGRMLQTLNVTEILAELAELPTTDPTLRRLRVWCHPVWAGLLIAMLGLFWIGRKMVGVV
jgi:hypothetical protein